MRPAKGEGADVEGPKEGADGGPGHEQRARRNEQADGELDGIDVIDQPLEPDPLEQLEVVVARGPRSERDERRSEGDPRLAQDAEGALDVGARMALFQVREHDIR